MSQSVHETPPPTVPSRRALLAGIGLAGAAGLAPRRPRPAWGREAPRPGVVS